MIRNVVQGVEQLSDGIVYVTAVFYSDDGSFGKELWTSAVDPPTPERLQQLVQEHAATLKVNQIDDATIKTLMQFVGTEIAPVKG